MSRLTLFVVLGVLFRSGLGLGQEENKKEDISVRTWATVGAEANGSTVLRWSGTGGLGGGEGRLLILDCPKVMPQLPDDPWRSLFEVTDSFESRLLAKSSVRSEKLVRKALDKAAGGKLAGTLPLDAVCLSDIVGIQVFKNKVYLCSMHTVNVDASSVVQILDQDGTLQSALYVRTNVPGSAPRGPCFAVVGEQEFALVYPDHNRSVFIYNAEKKEFQEIEFPENKEKEPELTFVVVDENGNEQRVGPPHGVEWTAEHETKAKRLEEHQWDDLPPHLKSLLEGSRQIEKEMAEKRKAMTGYVILPVVEAKWSLKKVGAIWPMDGGVFLVVDGDHQRAACVRADGSVVAAYEPLDRSRAKYQYLTAGPDYVVVFDEATSHIVLLDLSARVVAEFKSPVERRSLAVFAYGQDRLVLVDMQQRLLRFYQLGRQKR